MQTKKAIYIATMKKKTWHVSISLGATFIFLRYLFRDTLSATIQSRTNKTNILSSVLCIKTNLLYQVLLCTDVKQIRFNLRIYRGLTVSFASEQKTRRFYTMRPEDGKESTIMGAYLPRKQFVFLKVSFIFHFSMVVSCRCS